MPPTLLDIGAAAVLVDFGTIVLSKFFNLGKSLDKWYAKFQLLAVLSDCLIIVLGIQLAYILAPTASFFHVLFLALFIQILHDILFYFFVVLPIPAGHNQIIDLFKEYGAENSYKIILYDSFMVASTLLLATYLHRFDIRVVSFAGLLGVYALTYIIYTK
jgi:uncharacterized protein YacL